MADDHNAYVISCWWWFEARCSCGYVSGPRATHPAADTDARQHKGGTDG